MVRSGISTGDYTRRRTEERRANRGVHRCAAARQPERDTPTAKIRRGGVPEWLIGAVSKLEVPPALTRHDPPFRIWETVFSSSLWCPLNLFANNFGEQNVSN